MNSINSRVFLWLVVGFTGLVWVVAAAITDGFASIWRFAALTSTVVAVDGVAWLLFWKWLWKWPRLQGWLVRFPNLNGTWDGYISPSSTDSQQVERIPARLTIEQTLLSLRCTLRTAESTSYSYGATLQTEENTSVGRLVYSYSNSPRARFFYRSAPHEGTACLEILGKRSKKLQGPYWTSRATIGDIELSFSSRSHRDDFAARPTKPVVT